MSTTTAPSPNGASLVASATNSTAASTVAGSKSSQKTATTPKVLDGSRKQSASSVESSQKLPQTQKAWTSGTNPLTQRPLNVSRQNGSVIPTKPVSESKPGPTASQRGSNVSNKPSSDKMLSLLGSFVGCNAKITVQGGEQFTGIFSMKSLGTPQYTLKMTTRIASPASENINGSTDTSDELTGVGEDYTMTFDTKDLISLEVLNVTAEKASLPATNGAVTGFKTDTDISSGKLSFRERQLKQWEPSSDDSKVDLSLQSKGATSWNQFDENERKYGVKSTYDENIYTTEIDRSKPISKEREAAINKMVRDIESGKPSDAPGTEDDAEDLDEESRYSSVRREYQPVSSEGNKYTPPARRAPTGLATVPGAPVDPAIISSQLVRPDTSSKQSRDKESLATSQTSPHPNVPAVQQSDLASSTDAATTTTAGPSEEPGDAGGDKSDAKSSTEVVPVSGSSTGTAVNATANVERDVLESYRTWAVQEKMKTQMQRSQAAKREKELKLNDLRKFSTNFKLKTSVPPDLVPILAKDKHKQEEIIEKVQRQLDAQSATSKPLAAATDASSRSTTSSQVENTTDTDRAVPRAGRQSASGYTSGQRVERPGQLPNVSTPSATRPLGHRLAQNHQQHREKAMNLANISQPQPIPIPVMPLSGPPAINTDLNNMHIGPSIQSPNSALGTKFNAKAIEFRPNPAASSFTPVSNHSAAKSDTDTKTEKVSTAKPSFLEDKKDTPSSQRPSINDSFNPIPRMKREVEAEKKSTDYASNGGIPQAYRTLPTWEVAKENQDKSYVDMFEKYLIRAPSRSSSHASPANGPIPHQHQLPLHLQQGPYPVQSLPTPQGTPRHLHPQPHQVQPGTHFEDNRMHFSASQNSAYPSPRSQQQPMMYNPMFPQMQMHYGQQIPQFNMNPGQHISQMRMMPPGAQFINNPGQQMGTPMMMSPSNGASVMAIPAQGQIPMYSPNQPHVFPSPVTPIHAQQPLPGTYGSPRPVAPMMVQQGSQQGQMPSTYFMNPGQQNGFAYGQQHPNQMGSMRVPMPISQQPGFGTSPHLQHHYPVPQQPRQHSYSGYPSHMQPNQPMHHPNQASTDDPHRNGP